MCVCVRARACTTLTSAALPPQNESDDAMYYDKIEKHPDLEGKLRIRLHRTRGLIKPYWV